VTKMVRVAVASTMIFDVPDDGSSIETIGQRFKLAHTLYLGIPMETVTGQLWTLRAIEHFAVTRQGSKP